MPARKTGTFLNKLLHVIVSQNAGNGSYSWIRGSFLPGGICFYREEYRLPGETPGVGFTSLFCHEIIQKVELGEAPAVDKKAPPSEA